jgi:DNA replication protein DnaC
VHYARVPRLFADLDLAHGDGRFARLFRMLVRVDLLVLDDWGPDRLSASQRGDLMEIVEDHRRVDGDLAMTTAARKCNQMPCFCFDPASIFPARRHMVRRRMV